MEYGDDELIGRIGSNMKYLITAIIVSAVICAGGCKLQQQQQPEQQHTYYIGFASAVIADAVGHSATAIVVPTPTPKPNPDPPKPHKADPTTRPTIPTPPVERIEVEVRGCCDQVVNKPVLLVCYTDWCKWCKKLEKEIDGNKELKEIVEVRYFNCEKDDTYKVGSVPTLLLLVDGKEVKRKTGYLKQPELLKWAKAGAE